MAKVKALTRKGKVSPQQTLVEAQEVLEETGIKSLAIVFETPEGGVNMLMSTQNVADLALKTRLMEITLDKHFMKPRQ